MKLTSPNILLLIFIVLKLTHVIDWSWWWVLSPIWIVAILAFAYGFLVEITTGTTRL